ncbi:S41 family peptidase [Limnochorda pilosa]|uniref:Tail specific protease domain-containing protein n=1 Tax=Limnochorda pilosa TaxID=1555112 RepID=A0A0K2SGY7_LIMPI|nr:S41 family peptidase [Limnochorda pilosa]BAS26355.1 hypothetical protein LIP_0498 [Limnochorda pilosa]
MAHPLTRRRAFLKLLGAALLLRLLAGAPAARAAEPWFSSEQMQVDLRFLIRTLQEVHPALAKLEQRAAFEAKAQEALQGLPPFMSRGDFAFVAARVLQALPDPDAHTMMGYSSDGLVLSVRFRWTSDGLVVVQAEPDAPLRTGDAVVRMGGFTPPRLLEQLRPFIPAENDGWIRARGESLIHRVFVLRNLGAVAEDGSVEVVVRRPAATAADEPSEPGATPAPEVEEEISIRLVGSAALAALTPEEPQRPWFGWRIEPEHSLGLFWLDRCEDTPGYRSAVDAFFEAVHSSGVQKVAIDVRRNGGGNSAVMDAFLKYVPADAVRTYGGEIRFSAQADEQRGYTLVTRLAHWFSRLGSQTVRTPRPPRPELTFAGDLYVLTSEHTFSSAVWIATVLSDNGLATVVGEPTGGAPSGYGDILSFTLPESGLRFTVSHKRWIRPNPERDPANSLVPDHLVPTTVEDIRLQRDPQLEWVRAAGI